MKKSQIAVLMIAVVAGGLAGLVAMGSSGTSTPQQVVVQAPAQETVEVLVAATDVGIGDALTEASLEWREWPKDGAGLFITRTDQPDAVETFLAAVARTPFYAGEPIRRQKLMTTDGSGFMSAILPTGMLAIAVETEPSRSAGGFVLPNDRVDLIVTESFTEGDRDVFRSQTIVENVRVLAIDQTVEDTEEGQKVVVGETATLELTPLQAETAASAMEQGTMRLALRSLADSSGPGGDQPRLAKKTTGAGRTGTTVRFGDARPVLRQE